MLTKADKNFKKWIDENIVDEYMFINYRMPDPNYLYGMGVPCNILKNMYPIKHTDLEYDKYNVENLKDLLRRYKNDTKDTSTVLSLVAKHKIKVNGNGKSN